MRCVVFSLLLVACQSAPPPSGAATPSAPPTASPDTPVSSPPMQPGPTPPGNEPAWVTKAVDPNAPDDWRTCSESSECTLVQTTCCDVCNGGSVVTVNNAHVADAERQYDRGDCSRSVCTERGCMTRAACEGGRCVLQWGNFR
ncbi:MAG: hypothetical protein KC776_22700 [Myxococcales bacterium]|nr:hypothetical protein [Myxococcales bacterium]MCB9581467.1 hypothetical protein [Polyangiaceae bacterium]